MTGRISAVDSLRAIAMTMVIAQHSGLLPFGWTGVWLFYVISGFVISRNLIDDQVVVKPPASSQYLSFAVRRLFRIIPPYAAYIAICLIVIRFLNFPGQYSELPYLGTFVYNWRMIVSTDPQFPAFGHLWTICVEEQFYVLFPILILIFSRNLSIFALAVIVVVTPMFRNLMAEQMAALTWDSGRIAFGVYASSFGQFDAFAYGALLAHFEEPIRRNPKVAEKVFCLAVVFAVTYVGTYIGINVFGGARGLDIFRNIVSGVLAGEKREVFVYIVMDICAVAILAGAIVGWKIFRLIEQPVFIGVGKVSYGGYLIHSLVLLLISLAIHSPVGEESILARIGMFIVAWCITVAVAWTSYNFAERQLIRYGHSLSDLIIMKTKKQDTA
jgi:peptidoglycan/LPS O-acetylase OafA/YrhL